jgi:CBS domain-containing protein
VDNGRVVLSGPVLEDEVDYLIAMVSRVGGVKHVENRLEIHEDANNIPELQGSPDRPPRGERFEFMQVNWSPTARLLAGTAGGALALYGLRRSQTVGIGMATVGVALLARSLTNRELSRLFGVPATRRADRFSYGREWNGAGNGSAGPARSATTQKPVKDVMTPEVEVIRPDSSLQEAAEKMKTFNIGAIPVCDGDRLVGMLTDRDIAVRVVAEKRDAAETSVRDAMTSEVVYCYEDEDVGTASRIMADRQVRRLVVLNREKRLVGIVSLGDLAVQTSDRALGGKTLERISQPAEPQR